MSLLEVKHLKKVYTTRLGGQQCQALRDVDFTVEQGEFTAIMGESGTGFSHDCSKLSHDCRESLLQSWENPVPERRLF